MVWILLSPQGLPRPYFPPPIQLGGLRTSIIPLSFVLYISLTLDIKPRSRPLILRKINTKNDSRSYTYTLLGASYLVPPRRRRIVTSYTGAPLRTTLINDLLIKPISKPTLIVRAQPTTSSMSLSPSLASSSLIFFPILAKSFFLPLKPT